MNSRVLRLVMVVVLFFSFNSTAQANEWYILLFENLSKDKAESASTYYNSKVGNTVMMKMANGGYNVAIGAFLNRRLARHNINILVSKGIIPESSRILRIKSKRKFELIYVEPEEEDNAHEADHENYQESNNREERDAIGKSTKTLAEQLADLDPQNLPVERKREIQIALKWMGYYKGPIDSDFGPGTQRAVRDYQEAQFSPVNGYLSTEDILKLFTEFSRETGLLGFKEFQSIEAGMSLQMPLGVVRFEKAAPPFLEFTSKDSEIKIALFSQGGGERTLRRFFDVLKGIEFGQREIKRDFTGSSLFLISEGEKNGAYSYAVLSNGLVKGFSLVYPLSEREQMLRAGMLMQASLKTLDSVALSIGVDGPLSTPDLLNAEEIRSPDILRSGFYVAEDGVIVTDGAINNQCNRIDINGHIPAEITAQNNGTTLLNPKEPQQPSVWAQSTSSAPWPGEEVFSAGFFEFGQFGLASILTGKIKPQAEGATAPEAEIEATASELGGPVLNEFGAVYGVLSAREDGTRILPENIRMIRPVPALEKSQPQKKIGGEKLALEDLTAMAQKMTVSVACWY